MRFGSQCIVVSIDVKRCQDRDGWDVYIHGGRINTGLDAMEWLYEVQKRGAGEILLTSMDADGSMQGFDLPVLEQASKICKVPLIASGGAGTMEHFAQAARAGADACSIVISFWAFTDRYTEKVLGSAGDSYAAGWHPSIENTHGRDLCLISKIIYIYLLNG